MPATLSILFADTLEGSEAIYRVPNSVKGLVRLTVRDRPIDAQAITVCFSGMSKFKFRKHPSSHRTEIFVAETVITNQTIVIQTGSTASKPMAIGEHLFPFIFKTITEDGRLFYTSIQDYLGKIEYAIEAKTYSNQRSENISVKRQVILINLPRIDRLPSSDTLRQSGEVNLPLSFCCYIYGKVELSAEIPRGAYRPGETIDIRINISNSSQKIVTPKVALVQCRRIMVQGKQDKDSFKLFSQESVKDAVQPQTVNWNRTVSILLPKTLHPGSILDISYLEVTYHIKVAVSAPWEFFDAKIQLPIVIGQ